MKSILLLLLLGMSMTYDTRKAVSYARTYCSNYNTRYRNYRNSGGDCANFVSQCLIAGGYNLRDCYGADEYGAIPLVSNLEECLVAKGWKRSVGMPSAFKAGYPFFIPDEHAMIATGVSGDYVTYCGHTNDRCNAQMGAPDDWNYYYL